MTRERADSSARIVIIEDARDMSPLEPKIGEIPQQTSLSSNPATKKQRHHKGVVYPEMNGLRTLSIKASLGEQSFLIKRFDLRTCGIYNRLL